MEKVSRARIHDGVWTRAVPRKWRKKNGPWRTAIFKSVLADPRLRKCRYKFEGRPTIIIPVDELRRAVMDGPSYDDGRRWGPFDIDPLNRTVAGHVVRMLRDDEVSSNDSPEIAQLERELDKLQSLPKTPETLRRIQHVLKTYERPRSITRHVKRTRGATCQLCGELGFVKKNGMRYCEIHHIFHLSKNPPPKCLKPEYLVVLCATCHRRMHYADVGEPVRDGDGWRFRLDDIEHRFVTG